MAKRRTSLLELDRNTSGAMQLGYPGRKPGLRSLDAETNPRAGSRRVQAQSYDDGAAIALRTASGAFPMYPQQMAAATSPYSYADAFDYPDDVCFVEPFEDPAPATPAAPPDVETLPQAPAAPVTPATPAVAPPRPKEDNFEDDIRQILEKAAQEQQKPEPPQPIIKKPDQNEAPPAETPPEQAQQAGGTMGHEFFERAERNLAHATTFHVGQLDLNRRLNEIEHALDAEEQVTEQKALTKSFSEAAALDDDDIISDLSAVSSLLEEKLREEQTPAPQEPGPSADRIKPRQTPAETPTAATPAATTPEPPSAAAPEKPATPNTAPDAAQPPAGPAQTPAPAAVDLTYKVPVTQVTDGVSAQAAGAAMLVAWRDQAAIDMQVLVAGTGRWAAYAPGLKAGGPEFFRTWGLADIKPEALTIMRLHDMLKARGPLWLQNPAVESTVRIVVGRSGDGSEAGTPITVIDPTAGAREAQQKTNIRSLISQLGDGPVRIAHLTV